MAVKESWKNTEEDSSSFKLRFLVSNPLGTLKATELILVADQMG